MEQQSVGASGSAASPAVVAPSAGAEADATRSTQLASLFSELRAILAPHITPLSDRSHIIHDLQAIARALTVAVVGSAALPPPVVTVMSARDALELLCDTAKVRCRCIFAFTHQHRACHRCFLAVTSSFNPPRCSTQHTWKIWTRLKGSRFDAHVSMHPHVAALIFTARALQVIKALCSFIDEDTPLPAPADSCSKAVRRAQFRDVACPSAANCSKLKALIQHALALFEENQTEVHNFAALCCLLFARAVFAMHVFSHCILGSCSVRAQTATRQRISIFCTQQPNSYSSSSSASIR